MGISTTQTVRWFRGSGAARPRTVMMVAGLAAVVLTLSRTDLVCLVEDLSVGPLRGPLVHAPGGFVT